jgi:hypothetical protein
MAVFRSSPRLLILVLTFPFFSCDCYCVKQNGPRITFRRDPFSAQDSLSSSNTVEDSSASNVTALGTAGSGSSAFQALSDENNCDTGFFRKVLSGKRKWLGGAIHPQTGTIYGIPSHAVGILTIHPPPDNQSGEVVDRSVIPLPFNQTGKFKWLRGVIVHNTLYGIPAWFNHGILKVDLEGNHVSLLKLPFSPKERILSDSVLNHENDDSRGVDTTKWMWHGAATTADNKTILCVPSNAQRVLQIQVETNVVSEIGPKFHGQNKWYGGILGDDGAVYGIPYTARGVLRIGNPNGGNHNNNISIIGSFPEKQYLWHGGIKSPFNGAIYAFPSHANQVLKIHTRRESLGNAVSVDDICYEEQQQLSLLDIHRRADDSHCCRYQWLGGCIGANGCIYGVPSDATSILKIDPFTDRVTTFGHVSAQKNKWQGAVLSPIDGCIYCIPSNAEYVLQINTTGAVGSSSTGQTSYYQSNEGVRLVGSHLSSMKDKYQGGFLGKDGNIYCIPENAKQVLKITPATRDEDAHTCYL